MLAFDGNILRCPVCGEVNLHQDTVEVFNRRQEDGVSTAVLVQKNGAPIVGHPEHNPSEHREGVLIVFWCERCHDPEFDQHRFFKLAIYQEQGNTLMEWRFHNKS